MQHQHHVPCLTWRDRVPYAIANTWRRKGGRPPTATGNTRRTWRSARSPPSRDGPASTRHRESLRSNRMLTAPEMYGDAPEDRPSGRPASMSRRRSMFSARSSRGRNALGARGRSTSWSGSLGAARATRTTRMTVSWSTWRTCWGPRRKQLARLLPPSKRLSLLSWRSIGRARDRRMRRRIDVTIHSGPFWAGLLGWTRGARHRRRVSDRSTLAASHLAAIVLCGAGDMVPIARSLHRRTLGSDRAFCHMRPTPDRSLGFPCGVPENRTSGDGWRSRLQWAGTLCLRLRAFARTISQRLSRGYANARDVMLVVCAPDSVEVSPFVIRPAPIVLPPLAARDRRDQPHHLGVRGRCGGRARCGARQLHRARPCMGP